MRKQRIVLTREALYREVWSEPIVHVASRLGLVRSGAREVVRAARDSSASTRVVGKEAAWASSNVRFPCPRSPPRSRSCSNRGRPLDKPEDPPEIAREKTAEWQIEVPEDLPIAHPLLKKAAAAIRRSSRDKRSQGVPWHQRYQAKLLKPGPGCLDVAVSKASLPRAFRIMQALLTAFDRRGFAIRMTDKNETFVTVLDESFQIALVERFKQVVVKHSYGPGVDLEPSGRLMLRIGASYQNAGVADSPPRKVEDALNKFVVRLVRRALEAKRARAVYAERQARWRVEDEKNRLEEQQRDSEGLRRRRLQTAAVRWARHQRRVDLVNAVERRVRDGSMSPAERENAERWVAWATEQTARR